MVSANVPYGECMYAYILDLSQIGRQAIYTLTHNIHTTHELCMYINVYKIYITQINIKKVTRISLRV